MATIWDETKKQTAKMKGRPFKEKLSYFWEYYKIHTCIALGTIIFIGAIVHAVTSSKDYALSVVMINSLAGSIETNGGEDITETWTSDLSQLIDFNPKKYEVYVDTSISVGSDSTTANAEYAGVQKLAAMMSAKSIDVMIANTSEFEQYAQNQYYYDLRDIYTEEELNSMAGFIYYTDAATFSDYDEEDTDITVKQASYTVDHHDPSSMEDPVPCGFFTSEGTRPGDAGLYSYYTEDDTYQGYMQEGVMGIPINTPRLDAAKTAVEYFLEMK